MALNPGSRERAIQWRESAFKNHFGEGQVCLYA